MPDRIMKSLLCLLLVPSFLSPAIGAPMTEDEARALATEAIKRFHRDMRSDDEAVRQAAFDRFMPDRAILKRLFGAAGEALWPQVQAYQQELRAKTDQFKKDFDRHQDVVGVELINVRRDDLSGRYRELSQSVPEDIFLFRAVLDFGKGKGAAGWSTLVVADGQVRHIRGLEGLHKHIQELAKQQGPADDTASRGITGLPHAEAMKWIETHNHWGDQGDLLQNIKDLIAEADRLKRNATFEWGSALSREGKPYQLHWVHGRLFPLVLSADEASVLEMDDRTMNHTPWGEALVPATMPVQLADLSIDEGRALKALQPVKGRARVPADATVVATAALQMYFAHGDSVTQRWCYIEAFPPQDGVLSFDFGALNREQDAPDKRIAGRLVVFLRLFDGTDAHQAQGRVPISDTLAVVLHIGR